MTKKMYRVKPISFITLTFILLVLFVFFFGNRSTANSGNLNDDMKGFESVLIKKGDTLTDIAGKYSPKYSHVSSGEYMEAIVSLNSLSTQYIHAGEYILLPKYR